MNEQITVTLGCRVDMGWRYRVVMACAGWIGWLPDAILDPLTDWAVRGIRVHVGMEQVK